MESSGNGRSKTLNEELILYHIRCADEEIKHLREYCELLYRSISELDKEVDKLNIQIDILMLQSNDLEVAKDNFVTDHQVENTLREYFKDIVFNWKFWFALFMLYMCVDFNHLKEFLKTIFYKVYFN